MIPAEAGRVVGFLAAAFRTPLAEETVAVWVSELRPFHADVSEEAARRWLQEEDRFPSVASFLVMIREVQRDWDQDRALPPGAGSVCRECDGSGWVTTDPSGRGTVRPCSTCRTQVHEIWAGGHFMPNHDCEECRARRRESQRQASSRGRHESKKTGG